MCEIITICDKIILTTEAEGLFELKNWIYNNTSQTKIHKRNYDHLQLLLRLEYRRPHRVLPAVASFLAAYLDIASTNDSGVLSVVVVGG